LALPRRERGDRATTVSRGGVHFAFYAVLIAEGVTGVLASYFWWPISAAHVFLFKVFLALATIHVGAALWREIVRKEAVLGRIGIKSLFR